VRDDLLRLLPFAVFLLDWLVRIGLSVRVVMRRRSVGVSLAWLSVLLAFPLAGGVLYLLFGELRLGQTRMRRARAIHEGYRGWLRSLRERYPAPPAPEGAAWPSVMRLLDATLDWPPLPGNAITLLDDSDAVFDRLVADVDAARSTCLMAFYIWSPGGRADELAGALARAAARGVACRLLLDAVGSSAFFREGGAESLRARGVEVVAALPVKLYRVLFERFDLRLHRKVVVVDGRVAYTGSMNVADPRFFKQGAGVGEWVDAMARLEGPVVEALAAVFFEDWERETGQGAGPLRGVLPSAQPSPGAATVQAIPSGPTSPRVLTSAVLLQAIYEADREIVLTTPYFVPEEPLLLALASAAARGVEVHLVVPARNDSRLVDLSSRAFQGDLAGAGVHIWLFDAGLLHTKSVAVDGRLALFGSLNLDPRSLYLNFEITLAIDDPAFHATLRALQQTYIDRAEPFDLAAWKARPFGRQLAENLARLAGPLL
jgi:cardiolipin synthase